MRRTGLSPPEIWGFGGSAQTISRRRTTRRRRQQAFGSLAYKDRQMATRRQGKGEGSIRQREDGRWEATVDLGYQGAARKRKWFYGKTRREVQVKLIVFLTEQQQVPLAAPCRPRTPQYLDWWRRD